MNLKHSIAAVVRNSLRMSSDLFRSDLDEPRALQLFKDYVELVEFETTSYCNRTCSFCPNQFIDRRSEKNAMPERTWERIVEGLRKVSYKGTVVWSRYSEPLSEKRIVDRVRQIRAAAPECRICINTNGDYLDPEYLHDLAQAGVNRLWVDLYLPQDDTYELDMAREYMQKFFDRIAKSAVPPASEYPELCCNIAHEGIELAITCRNMASMNIGDRKSDRAGLIQLDRAAPRVAPCYAPYKHLVIDWDGSVVVCCQMRSDAGKHASGIVGKVGADLDLIQAYGRLGEWRKSLKDFAEKASPCDTCTVAEYVSNPLTRGLAKTLGGDTILHQLARKSLDPMIGWRSRY